MNFCRETLKYGIFVAKILTYAFGENDSGSTQDRRKSHRFCCPGKYLHIGKHCILALVGRHKHDLHPKFGSSLGEKLLIFLNIWYICSVFAEFQISNSKSRHIYLVELSQHRSEPSARGAPVGWEVVQHKLLTNVFFMKRNFETYGKVQHNLMTKVFY